MYENSFQVISYISLGLNLWLLIQALRTQDKLISKEESWANNLRGYIAALKEVSNPNEAERVAKSILSMLNDIEMDLRSHFSYRQKEIKNIKHFNKVHDLQNK